MFSLDLILASKHSKFSFNLSHFDTTDSVVLNQMFMTLEPRMRFRVRTPSTVLKLSLRLRFDFEYINV